MTTPTIALDAAMKLYKRQEAITAYQLNQARERRDRSPRYASNSIESRVNWYYLYAVNYYSRLMFAKIYLDEVFDFFEISEIDEPAGQPAFLVSVCDASLTTSDKDPPISMKRVKTRIYQALAGLSYLGMIEPGYFTNITEDNRRRTRELSWHAHVIVWGTSKEELQRRFSWLKGKQKGNPPPFRPFIGVRPGLNPLHFKTIIPGTLERVLRHILKSPRKEYSLFKNQVASDKYGRTIFTSKPRPIRPGNQYKLFNVMKTELFLDQMMVSGGAGKAIAQRTKNRSLATFRRRRRAELGV
jgi:hypothetical protein